MALRRDSSPPVSVIDALTQRLDVLERELTKIEQPGRRGFTVMNYLKQFDAPEGEIIINTEGDHIEATPTDPLVYWHQDRWNKLGGAQARPPTGRCNGGEVSIPSGSVTNAFGLLGSNTYELEFAEDFIEEPGDGEGLILNPGIYFIQTQSWWGQSGIATGLRRCTVNTSATMHDYLTIGWTDADSLSAAVYQPIFGVWINLGGQDHIKVYAQQLSGGGQDFAFDLQAWRLSDAP